MRRLLPLLIMLLISSSVHAYTTPDGVCGFASGHEIQIEVCNISDDPTCSTPEVAYTATGVWEVARVKSCYYYNVAYTPPKSYQICMKDVDVTPNKEQCFNVAAYQTSVDAAISGLATQTSVNAIPTNPLLTNDSRLDNLDAPVSEAGSSLTGTYQATITVYEHGTTTPIPDYNLHVYNSTETVFFGTVKTNSLGVATFNRDSGTYKLRGQLFGFTPETASETVIIAGADKTQTLYATAVAIGSPVAADACRVYEYLYRADDSNKPTTVTAEAQIVKLPFDAGTKLHKGDIVAGTYDATTGLTYWDIVVGATVRFKIKDFGIDDTGVIPDSSTVRLFGTAAEVTAGTAVISPSSRIQ